MKIRVAIADDHRVMLGALEALLAAEPDIEVVGTASDGLDLLDLVGRVTPDVVVMDIAMPRLNGIETLERLRAADGPDVLVLSGYTDKRFVLEALNAGARGYVVKSSAADELPRAIRSIAQGDCYLCPEVAGAVVESAQEQRRSGPAPVRLAPRERTIVRLLAEGKTSAQIGVELHIAASTVDTHRRNIMRKLGMHSVVEVIRYAIREGIAAA